MLKSKLKRYIPGLETHRHDCLCVACKHKRGEVVLHKRTCLCASCLSKKGKGWNIGLTKETHAGIKSQSEKMEGRTGKTSWSKGLTKEIDVRILKHSNLMKKWLGNPFRQGISRIQSLDERKKRGQTIQKIWNNMPIEVKDKRVVKSRLIAGSRPNNCEKKLQNILNSFFPGEYKYVGDGKVILAGKCPDFINVNGKKKIIEHFGSYWHKGDSGKKRVKLFKQYGYNTLIVREKELKSEEDLKNKLISFHNSALGGR